MQHRGTSSSLNNSPSRLWNEALCDGNRSRKKSVILSRDIFRAQLWERRLLTMRPNPPPYVDVRLQLLSSFATVLLVERKMCKQCCTAGGALTRLTRYSDEACRGNVCVWSHHTPSKVIVGYEKKNELRWLRVCLRMASWKSKAVVSSGSYTSTTQRSCLWYESWSVFATSAAAVRCVSWGEGAAFPCVWTRWGKRQWHLPNSNKS